MAGSEEGREVIRHSTAHVLAQAVLDLHQGAHFAIGPPIEDGFYYDFDIGRPFTPDDLAAIERRMRDIVAEDQPFSREELTREQALGVFSDQPFKREIIESVDPGEMGGGEVVSVYRNDGFVDLCRGPHLSSTGRIPAFTLLRTAGAYWRGDERRPQLQRIYGTAWESRQALDDHLHRLEEAELRDHRRLGPELRLYAFPRELGQGLAVWLPNGGMIRKLMEDHSRRLHERFGFQFVISPHLARSELWHTSGHLDYYAENMFPGMEVDEGVEYRVKPMNCPFHVLIYRSHGHSYRDLPVRLSELGSVYRRERSGVLHGLLRARGFTQDDSHTFCRRDQVGEELDLHLDFVLTWLRHFGFEEFEADLSTRDPEKAMGDLALMGGGDCRAARLSRRRWCALSGCRRRGSLLRAEDRCPCQGRHRATLADVDDPARLLLPRAVRIGIRHIGQPPRAPGDDSLCQSGVFGEVLGCWSSTTRAPFRCGWPRFRRQWCPWPTDIWITPRSGRTTSRRGHQGRRSTAPTTP